MTTHVKDSLPMKVNVDQKGLECSVNVKIAADFVDQQFNSKVNQLTQTRRHGFRPGKVPASIIIESYRPEILQEITVDLTQKSFEQALKQHDLDMADQPDMDIKPVDLGSGLTYTAKFECLPKVELKDLSDIKLINPVSEVSDKEVKEAYKEAIDKHPDWKKVDRAAKKGDQVTIDFDGKVGGESFEGGSAKGHSFRLGHKQMLDDFEAPLVGKKKGDKVKAKVTFPEDYHAEDMRGKKAVFEISLSGVEEAKAPKINQDLFKKMGSQAETEEDYCQELRGVKEKELRYQLQRLRKHYAEEALNKAHQFDLPKSMCESEETRLKKLPEAKDYDAKKLQSKSSDNVKISLIFKAIVNKYNIVLDQARFDGYLRDLAVSYLDVDMFVNWYKEDKGRVQHAQAAVMEAQIIDKVFEAAKLKESKLTVEKLEKLLDSLE
ncbi:MAG TPA: trigger factor [Gammaproteobacteria bacterium]|nr:trigger factor [Gammaproteobacteria bacterium]